MNDEELPEHNTRVSEAVAMVCAQADCTVEEAFVAMHERVTMTGVTMEDVIDAVVHGTVRFDLN